MGTQTGMDIADRAWIKVNEVTGGGAVRYTAAEALLWLNDAQRAVVAISSKANTVRSTPTLAAGARQDLLAMGLTDSISLVAIHGLLDAAGSRIGAMNKRPRALFDDNLATWQTTPGDPEHWIHDDAEPTVFWIYPQPTATRKVELTRAAQPADLISLNDAISLPDSYAEALQFYLLFSFYSKDTNYTRNPQLAGSYYGLFQGAVGKTIASNAANETMGAAQAAGASSV